MDIFIHDRIIDWYDVVADTMVVTDYFDFPSSMIAFGESLKTSTLAVADDCWFRLRNKQITLISYQSAVQLANVWSTLLDDGYKVKSLNFVNKPHDGLLTTSYGKEWHVPVDWSVKQAIASAAGSKVRRKLRRAIDLTDNYSVDDNLNEVDAMELFNVWLCAAKQRHFMVVKGHYIRYLERYFHYCNNVHMLAYRNSGGKLVGMVGYEVFGGNAQITLGKHVESEGYYFSRFMWMNAIQHILDEHHPKKVYFGTTCDDLKSQMGMAYAKSFKVRGVTSNEKFGD